MHTYIFNTVVNIIQILLFMIGTYYLAVAYFSLFGRRGGGSGDEDITFAVVIPAHNEEKTLEALIKSIRQTEYPQDRVSILVVADGCSDNTEAVAKRCGAEVLVRRVSNNKGEALNAAFLYLRKLGWRFDCVTVFDADNIVDPRFFTEISERISDTNPVVQGYVDSKNPNSSWVSYAYSVWYWINNRTFQAGRARLNLGSRLNGTGFAIKKEVLDRIEWETTTSAEDSEYTCMLAANDIRIDFCERAVVFDEKPVSFISSVRQRIRWTQGICDVQGEYTTKFIKGFKLNALLGLWGDFLSIVCPIILALFAVFNIGGMWHTTFAAISLAVFFGMYIIVVGLALIKDNKFSFKIILNSLGFLIYMLSWIPIGIRGIFSKRGSWIHTEHS